MLEVYLLSAVYVSINDIFLIFIFYYNIIDSFTSVCLSVEITISQITIEIDLHFIILCFSGLKNTLNIKLKN